MERCTLNLSNLEVEKRSHFVFYATHKFIIYKDYNWIWMNSCDDKEIGRVSSPSDYVKYECLDLGNKIVMVLAGKYFAMFDTTGPSYGYLLPIERIGKCITKLFLSQNTNAILFGTSFHGKTHFLNFDFVEEERISQTTSWEMPNITDAILDDKILYILLDNTFIITINSETSETLWRRFETGRIIPYILPSPKGLLYSCQNLLKIASEKKIDIIRIPLVRVSSLEGVVDNNLYLTCNNSKNLCCYNLLENKVLWEITGILPILETLIVQGRIKENIHDIMILRTEDNVAIVDLTIGRMFHQFRCRNISRIRQTGDHVLIHHHNSNETEMIAGESND